MARQNLKPWAITQVHCIVAIWFNPWPHLSNSSFLAPQARKMEEPSVVEQLRKGSRVSLALTKRDVHRMELLMESGKQLMWDQAVQLFKGCGGMPFLTSYSCDGTPCKHDHAEDLLGWTINDSTIVLCLRVMP